MQFPTSQYFTTLTLPRFTSVLHFRKTSQFSSTLCDAALHEPVDCLQRSYDKCPINTLNFKIRLTVSTNFTSKVWGFFELFLVW